MVSVPFRDIVRNNLEPLLSEYGYQIKFIGPPADLLAQDGSAYIYSEKTVVYVMKSRFDYLITLMPAGEPEFTRMSIWWIVEALSVNRADAVSVPSGIDTFDNYVHFYTGLIKRYCMPFIRGDYSEWLKVLEYFINKSKTDYKQRTGRQLPERVHHDLAMYIKEKKRLKSK